MTSGSIGRILMLTSGMKKKSNPLRNPPENACRRLEARGVKDG